MGQGASCHLQLLLRSYAGYLLHLALLKPLNSELYLYF
uniref:Uncharacterized protein n=1 Tax=Arundo donax TaxID=35708 RepID=A0A0A9AI35_ARUDO